MRLYNVVHILVGTPGRVLDLADKGIANLKECNTLIMDEASVFFCFFLGRVSCFVFYVCLLRLLCLCFLFCFIADTPVVVSLFLFSLGFFCFVLFFFHFFVQLVASFIFWLLSCFVVFSINNFVSI